MALIYIGINPDSSGADATPYVQLFNATTSWGTASGGVYTIVIPKTTHGKTISPIVQVYELDTGIYSEVIMHSIDIDAFGNVTIVVTETPDSRFEGRISIL